jgi:uncharacterized membrane-anchored protein YhcB (DUF1043 family)
MSKVRIETVSTPLILLMVGTVAATVHLAHLNDNESGRRKDVETQLTTCKFEKDKLQSRLDTHQNQLIAAESTIEQLRLELNDKQHAITQMQRRLDAPTAQHPVAVTPAQPAPAPTGIRPDREITAQVSAIDALSLFAILGAQAAIAIGGFAAARHGRNDRRRCTQLEAELDQTHRRLEQQRQTYQRAWSLEAQKVAELNRRLQDQTPNV